MAAARSLALRLGRRWLSGGAAGAEAALSRVRNFGIIAHIDAGKTTTTERMLLCAGAIRRAGDVDHGNTVTDFLEEERERGITIQAAAVSLRWAEYALNLIDTPGHVDFASEVEKALRVLDGAVVVVDAVAGVQAQTEAVWRQARAQGLPAIAFVNKLDRDGADFDRAVASLGARLGVRALALQLPVLAAAADGGGGSRVEAIVDLVRMELVEWRASDDGAAPPARAAKHAVAAPLVRVARALSAAGGADAPLLAAARARRLALAEGLAEVDDAFADAFLSADDPSLLPAVALLAGLRRATLACAAVPVVCGAALRGVGVESLLDAACALLPAPCDRPSPELRAPSLPPGASPSRPLGAPAGVALAFKVVHDSQRRPIVFARVYRGELTARGALLNASAGAVERPTGLFRVAGDAYEPLDVVRAGEICALSGLKATATGDTLLCASKGYGAGLGLAPAQAHAGEGGGAEGGAEPRRRRAPHARRAAAPGGAWSLPTLAGVRVPEPVFFVSLEAESAAQHAALDAALGCLALEDPSLQVRAARETGQLLLAGMGELHLEVAVKRLGREFGCPVRVGRMRVGYRETVTAAREAPLVHVAGSARALAGKVHPIELELAVCGEAADAAHAYRAAAAAAAAAAADPLAPDGGALSRLAPRLVERLRKQECEALLAGLEDGLAAGPLAGFPAMGVAAELLAATFEPGTPLLALRLAATEAAAGALAAAGPALLEPVMAVEILSPDSHVGAVLSDLSAHRRAAVLGVEAEAGAGPRLGVQRVRALVPLAELVGYSTALRSLTHGEGGLALEFAHYGRLDAAAESAVLLDARGY